MSTYEGTKMDIEQIRSAKEEMERGILAAVHDAMTEFHKKTGTSPQSISVELVEVATVGEKESQRMVANVRAQVTI